jgi:hypothetical protein
VFGVKRLFNVFISQQIVFWRVELTKDPIIKLLV